MVKTNLSQSQIVNFLKNSNAYSHHVDLPIRTEETHISWILLTGKFVYKIKKATRFGDVLDFSTLKKRKRYCQIEVDLNKQLCPDMYKGVVKIVPTNNNSVKVVNMKSSEAPIEYAVKMKEIPTKYRMDMLLKDGKLTDQTITNLSKKLAKFHECAYTNKRIRNSGEPKVITDKIKENFRTLKKMKYTNHAVEKGLLSFIQKNKPLLKKRILDNKIKEIHGDLYTKNIFIVPRQKKNRFYLYDRVEFNELLRYADVAEDVGHLSMDLDFQKQTRFRKKLIQSYIEKSGDFDLDPLVYFIMCFKASMRAKVAVFRAANTSDTKIKRKHDLEAKRLFGLAERYLSLF